MHKITPFVMFNDQAEQAATLYVSIFPHARVLSVSRYADAGGTPSQCGWFRDRFGLSWQIVPSILQIFLSDPNPAAAGRVMQAMLGVSKLDIAGLQAAHDGVELDTI